MPSESGLVLEQLISLLGLKGYNLLIMGIFNKFLVFNQFCMDKIKY